MKNCFLNKKCFCCIYMQIVAYILTDNWHLAYLHISAIFMQIFADIYNDRYLTYLQISATFMQIFCRYCRPCCSYAAVLQQICDRYLQTFYIYVSLVRVSSINRYYNSNTYSIQIQLRYGHETTAPVWLSKQMQ